MSRSSRRKPTHRVYAVLRRRTPVACWMDIGAAISHKDGKGFDLELQSMPLRAEELVVRTMDEQIARDGTLIPATAKRRMTARRSLPMNHLSSAVA